MPDDALLYMRGFYDFESAQIYKQKKSIYTYTITFVSI